MKIRKKKGFSALLAISVCSLAAFGAYAYFTQAGSGSGTATVGTSSAIQLSSPLVGTLYPGGADVPVTVTIQNPGTGSQYVDTVSGSVQDNGLCLGSWFQVDSITYQTTLAAGASDTSGTSVRMLDPGTNQDVCKGKTMVITWASN